MAHRVSYIKGDFEMGGTVPFLCMFFQVGPILMIILGVEGIRRKVPPVLYQVEGRRVLGCQQDLDA